MTSNSASVRLACFVSLFFLSSSPAAAQTVPAGPPQEVKAPPPVVKVGPNLLRIGRVEVNTETKEVTVPGHVNKNDVPILEFVANTQNGFKAYESAITLDTDAITFNAALLLIGLDPAHARVPKMHFDPTPPAGDGVDVTVNWTADGKPRTVRVEELLLDKRTNTTMPAGPWVYTGSVFLEGTTQFLAQNDGVLIGFVHSPAPLIENPRDGAVGAYGSIVLNDKLIAPGTTVTVTVKSLGKIIK